MTASHLLLIQLDCSRFNFAQLNLCCLFYYQWLNCISIYTIIMMMMSDSMIDYGKLLMCWCDEFEYCWSTNNDNRNMNKNCQSVVLLTKVNLVSSSSNRRQSLSLFSAFLQIVTASCVQLTPDNLTCCLRIGFNLCSLIALTSITTKNYILCRVMISRLELAVVVSSYWLIELRYNCNPSDRERVREILKITWLHNQMSSAGWCCWGRRVAGGKCWLA